jgi:hypothetical protein
MSTAKQIRVASTNANDTFTVDLQDTYLVGLPVTARAILQHSTSGAVAGSVDVYQGSMLDSTAVYDDTAAATIAPSGTDLASASESFQPTGNRMWKFVLSSLSASTTCTILLEVGE